MPGSERVTHQHRAWGTLAKRYQRSLVGQGLQTELLLLPLENPRPLTQSHHSARPWEITLECSSPRGRKSFMVSNGETGETQPVGYRARGGRGLGVWDPCGEGEPCQGWGW